MFAFVGDAFRCLCAYVCVCVHVCMRVCLLMVFMCLWVLCAMRLALYAFLWFCCDDVFRCLGGDVRMRLCG